MKKSELRQLIKEEIQKQLLNTYKLAKFIDNLNIPSEAFHPQDKETVVNVIKDGNVSSFYLEKISNILKKNNIDFNLSDFMYNKPTSTPSSEKITPGINPYDPLYKKHYNYPSEAGD
jgi:hypothetical protein